MSFVFGRGAGIGAGGVPGDFTGEELFYQNRISWTAPDPGMSPILNYRVYRAVSGNPLALYDTVSSAFTYYSNLMDESDVGVVYDYAVSAVNAVGEGEKTAVVSLDASEVGRIITGYNEA